VNKNQILTNDLCLSPLRPQVGLDDRYNPADDVIKGLPIVRKIEFYIKFISRVEE